MWLLESEVSGSREGAGGGLDTQSEALSTSTISRADDSQRMKELEDTFEERYMRVRLTNTPPLPHTHTGIASPTFSLGVSWHIKEINIPPE